jgi:hypothetical protein
MFDWVVWGSLFVWAIFLVFPPRLFKSRSRRFWAIFVFILLEVFLEWDVFRQISSPDFDDSAGTLLIPPLMFLPTVFLLILIVFRLMVFVLDRFLGGQTKSQEKLAAVKG